MLDSLRLQALLANMLATKQATKIAKCMYQGPEKNDGRQVNKKFRKFGRKYRDCIKRNGDKIGTQTSYDISTYP